VILPIISKEEALAIAGDKLKHCYIPPLIFKNDKYDSALAAFRIKNITPIGILGVPGTVTNVIFGMAE